MTKVFLLYEDHMVHTVYSSLSVAEEAKKWFENHINSRFTVIEKEVRHGT